MRNLAPNSLPVPAKFQFVPEWDDDFLQLFPFRHSYLWAEHPAPGQRPQWVTEDRHPLTDRLLQQGAYLYGVRFNKTTHYLMIDIDLKSQYHPSKDPFAIGRMVEALEPLGLYSYFAVTSSYSGGLHLYFPFFLGQTSWKLAHAAEVLLQNRGFVLNRGQLELFPHPRRSADVDYNGHRLPLQAGSYLLNEDFQPIYTSHTAFVQTWRFTQNRNSVREEKIDLVLKQFGRKAGKLHSHKAQKFYNDLNAEVERGWTDFGQTNYILGRIALREYVFYHVIYGGYPLKGNRLAERILEVAETLPGYTQYCRHQHEIHLLCLDWARSVELHPEYYPYGGKGLEQDVPEQNFEPTYNDKKSEKAINRLKWMVDVAIQIGDFPKSATRRFSFLKHIGRFGSNFLYRWKQLWHPDFLEPLQDGVFPTPCESAGDARSLEPLQDGVFPTIAPNKLCADLTDAPPEREVSQANTVAVEGARGSFPQVELTREAAEGIGFVKRILQNLRSARSQSAIPNSDLPPPDENWFKLSLGGSDG